MNKEPFIDLAIVVAVARNGTIGRDNDLPWRLPKDLQHFKRTTMGFPIVMGRNTFDSIGKPLPGRTNIVVTRQQGWSAEGVAVTHSLEQAITVGREKAAASGVNTVMVIGGADFYRQVLPQVATLFLTEVHADIEGDVHFPPIDKEQWVEQARENHEADGVNPYPYSFVTLKRANSC
ncbi:dihydrofolate reductase [Teredinibacter purpureus]|uniref:dihydrofolate reductase n=1 Tax=Teredinibacter purpureus TaxID=2731756 RepID=UPI0005F7BA80|nr:dihydrofolate reductase [Teredinibacter purpureus]